MSGPGPGLIQFRWGATIAGQVELSLCPVERRGLLLGLHLEPKHRRRGVGRVLARAAAARGVGFSWSANPPDETDAAAF
ncbi:GNAT family N-acetyltransferase [Amycolatopsis mediterranei]|uniref:GNAT family N-acetyltransferase n=1 Tax=Amycolatopsis mediterranei TaxID=33910 RepID=UPI0034465A91